MSNDTRNNLCSLACCVVVAATAFLTMVSPSHAAVEDASAAAGSKHGGHLLKDYRELETYISSAQSRVMSLQHPDQVQLTAARQPILGGMQALAAVQSFMGQPIEAVKTFDGEERLWNDWIEKPKVIGDREKDIRAIQSAHAVDALDAIVASAQHRQIVILNEAHHVSYHRLFAGQLAKRLRSLGFTYLACETFEGTSTEILSDGYVSQRTGHYSEEPTFAGFLTDAIRDGWKFTSYEPDPNDGEREFAMARNIERRILEKDPNARIFIYVGYSHGQKFPASTSDSDGRRFAAQLKRQSGIDPLTIDQTVLFDHYSSDQQSNYYALALKKLRSPDPAVLVRPNGSNFSFSAPEMSYDFEVVYPRYGISQKTQRPQWLDAWLSAGRTARDIPPNLLSNNATRVIYAYRANSPKDAVPYDVVTVRPGEPVPKMILPAGDYDFEYEE